MSYPPESFYSFVWGMADLLRPALIPTEAPRTYFVKEPIFMSTGTPQSYRFGIKPKQVPVPPFVMTDIYVGIDDADIANATRYTLTPDFFFSIPETATEFTVWAQDIYPGGHKAPMSLPNTQSVEQAINLPATESPLTEYMGVFDDQA